MTRKEQELIEVLHHIAQATCRCTVRERMSGHRADCQLPNLEDHLINLHETFNEELEA